MYLHFFFSFKAKLDLIVPEEMLYRGTNRLTTDQLKGRHVGCLSRENKIKWIKLNSCSQFLCGAKNVAN